MSGITQHLSTGDWLLSLGITYTRLICAAAHARTSFFVEAEELPLVPTWLLLFILSPVDGHLDHLQVGCWESWPYRGTGVFKIKY